MVTGICVEKDASCLCKNSGAAVPSFGTERLLRKKVKSKNAFGRQLDCRSGLVPEDALPYAIREHD
jgi:hypothetical protein